MTLSKSPFPVAALVAVAALRQEGVSQLNNAAYRKTRRSRPPYFDGEVRGHTPIYVHVADKQVKVRVPDQISKT